MILWLEWIGFRLLSGYYAGSNPARIANNLDVAQQEEHPPPKRKRTGSTPVVKANAGMTMIRTIDYLWFSAGLVGWTIFCIREFVQLAHTDVTFGAALKQAFIGNVVISPLAALLGPVYLFGISWMVVMDIFAATQFYMED